MTSQNVGILHPGAMGISVAASIQKSGHTVYWMSEGRSLQTRERAEKFGLRDTSSLGHLCETCSVIVSVCPPDAAEAVANQVLAHAFQGLYLDANAISPQRALRIGQAMEEAGVLFVDGGIIGRPAWQPGRTWLHLSGQAAEKAAACFSAGPLQTSVVGEMIGKASALKMCYAAYSKGTTALLCAILATAESLDVREALEQQWTRDDPTFTEQTRQRVRQVTAKAWRFAGEMGEIAATLREEGLPADFHLAAAEIYHRLAPFKGMPEIPSLESVLAALLQKDTESPP